MTKLISLRLAILLTFAGICYGGIRSFAAQQTPLEIRAQADKYWKEGSYSQAQSSYSKLLVADPKASDRIEIELRIAISLIRSAEWDKAIEATSAFDKANKHTTEDAEMQLWVGRLYHLVPHVGYKVKDKVTRGYNVPASDGGVAPIQVDLAAEDNKKSYDGFVSSLKLTEVIRKSGHIDHRELAILHEIEVASDLISKLEETRYWSLPTDKSYDWSIDATKPFDEKWRLPKQVMYLYKLISTLDKSQPESDHHATVLAELGRACYILRLREPQRWYSPQYSEMQVSSRTGRGGFRPIPPRPIYFIPYQDEDPLDILAAAETKYSSDRDADRLAFTIARWTEQKGDTEGAIGKYRYFYQTYPNSRWVSDAKASLYQVFNPSLNIGTRPVIKLGEDAVVRISSISTGRC